MVGVIADRTGEPWFNGNDVCEALGYVNPRQAIRNTGQYSQPKSESVPQGLHGKMIISFENGIMGTATVVSSDSIVCNGENLPARLVLISS